MVKGEPMMPSLVASTWKLDSSSEALGELNASEPLVDCKVQLASRFQMWRKLEVLLRQRIWLVPLMVSAASICHSLLSLPVLLTPQGAEISCRVPATSTKAMPSARLSSLVLPWVSRMVKGEPVMPSLVAST